jgi:hypothetical protein
VDQSVGEPFAGRRLRTRGGGRQVEEQRRLAQRLRPVRIRADDEQPAVQRVPATVLDGRREHVQSVRRRRVQVPQHGASPQVGRAALLHVAPHRLEQRVARRHPLQRRIVAQHALVERDALILPAEPPEARLQAFADRRERLRHPAHPIDVFLATHRRRVHAGHGAARDEEVLDHFWHEPAFLRLDGLPDQGGEVQRLLREPFQR